MNTPPFLILAIEKEYLNRLKNINQTLILEQNPSQQIVNPLTIIQYYYPQGLKYVQIIDESENLLLFKGIKENFPQLQVIGGGKIDSINRAEKFIQVGCDYLVVGRYFIEHPEKIALFLKKFDHKLIVSIDDQNAYINHSQIKTTDFIKSISQFAIKNLLYVNCSKILKNQGVAIDSPILNSIKTYFPQVKLIYSGGVKSSADIKALSTIGVNAIIVGTALYQQQISL